MPPVLKIIIFACSTLRPGVTWDGNALEALPLLWGGASAALLYWMVAMC